MRRMSLFAAAVVAVSGIVAANAQTADRRPDNFKQVPAYGPRVVDLNSVRPDGGGGNTTVGSGAQAGPGTGNQGTGNQGTGDLGTGNQGTGDLGTGNRGTGNRGTGNRGTGNRGTGSRGTGTQGTGDVRPSDIDQGANQGTGGGGPGAGAGGGPADSRIVFPTAGVQGNNGQPQTNTPLAPAPAR